MGQIDWFVRRNLKLRHLRLLVALDDLRNVRKVGESLNVTQPAVSKTLAEIERGLGIVLFERTAQGLKPTVYGECMVNHARTMLANLNVARDELRGLLSGASGKVRVGALPTTAPALLPRALALLKQRSPGTSVTIREGTQDALVPELVHGNIDLFVGTLPDARTLHVEGKVLFEDRFFLVTGKSHALASEPRVRWADLRGYPWALPPVGSLLREPLETAFERHGVPIPADHIETLSVQLICSYVQVTDAIACMREEIARHYQALNLIHVLPLQLPKLLGPVGMTWNSERALSSSMRLMMQCLEQTVAMMPASV